jgi:hypothetical protein
MHIFYMKKNILHESFNTISMSVDQFGTERFSIDVNLYRLTNLFLLLPLYVGQHQCDDFVVLVEGALVW